MTAVLVWIGVLALLSPFVIGAGEYVWNLARRETRSAAVAGTAECVGIVAAWCVILTVLGLIGLALGLTQL